MRSRFRHAIAAGVGLGLACAPAPSSPPPAQRDASLAATLVELGEQALAAGDPVGAADRFERALRADPQSLAARVGVGRSALAQGHDPAARDAFGSALEVAPDSVDALLGLARVEERSQRLDEARALLERARSHEPTRPDVHERLAALTGFAPRRPPADLDEALERVRLHLYDPRAKLHAGRALARAGRPEQAIRLLEDALWIGDRDPGATRAVLIELARLDPSWRQRIAVPVHVRADEALHANPSWRFQLRLLWHAISQSFDPVLRVRFYPAELTACRSSGAGPDLGTIVAACLRGPASTRGIQAVFTGQPAPRRGGPWRLGQAEFLGRTLAVRIEPGAIQSRVLAHELVHLYGGVHVNPDVDSLMNPSGDSHVLDPWNQALLEQLRRRRFGPGGLDANVLPWVELPATIAAYRAALGANLAFRQLGLLDALEAGRESRFLAARRARQVRELDEHLGDVTELLGQLVLRDGRPAAAAVLMDTAARLYGPGTPRGRAALAQARRLESAATVRTSP